MTPDADEGTAERRESTHPRGTVMTSAMLKAVANPLRRRITNVLNRLDHARAVDLAAELGVAANNISFHLRVLADAGLIEEAPEFARDRRDRVWKVSRIPALEVGNPEHPVEDEIAGAAFTQLIVDEHQDLVRRLIAWAPNYLQGREDVMRGTFQQRHIRLTREEFERVMGRVNEVFAEADEAHDKDGPESLYWQVDVIAADETI
ncbi:winged helix-turn-helix domain-containing protein [Microbacterium sp. ARD32]|uniref:ArsR/SmtB family transcription factor n=1 Tax=Microbacterium sp. ARD32 TaxID=2962577 RepID=UPI0028820CB4|nr:winged helix-turn-helix domain-containing protein [Microbacterium sp. ARD32]MDT0157689.1 winged helix-turn-helix domain-containing protein [Microbacterium sp. ARD32]